MDRFNKLTPAEDERLSMLAEECAEVIKAVMKIKRHGWESRHPDGGPTNRDLLVNELGDVWAVTHIMLDADDIGGIPLSEEAIQRRLKHTHHQSYPYPKTDHLPVGVHPNSPYAHTASDPDDFPY